MSEFSIFGKYLYYDFSNEFICFTKDELNKALNSMQNRKMSIL